MLSIFFFVKKLLWDVNTIFLRIYIKLVTCHIFLFYWITILLCYQIIATCILHNVLCIKIIYPELPQQISHRNVIINGNNLVCFKRLPAYELQNFLINNTEKSCYNLYTVKYHASRSFSSQHVQLLPWHLPCSVWMHNKYLFFFFN